MGGKGAKERRRLQRLSSKKPSQEQVEHHPERQIDQSDRNLNQVVANRKSSAHRTGISSDRVGISCPRGERSERQHGMSEISKETSNQPKRKKPKHLKRKIDQLEGGDEYQRNILVKALRQFEEQKLQYSNKKQTLPDVNRSISVSKTLSRTVVQHSAPVPAADASLTFDDGIIEKDMKDEYDDARLPTAGVDSDSETDVSLAQDAKRRRGRRRRGRQQTSDLTHKSQTEEFQTASAVLDLEEQIKNPVNDEVARQAKKTKKKDDTRRCIGRKPVTDFIVGQRYNGKVVYVKPFGVFIDLGCHSDAFCHVSRVRDDFVDSITDVLQEGDEVNARVIEIDRKGKRITVSLQSDARIDDERTSLEAKKNRTERRKKAKEKNPSSASNVTTLSSNQKLISEDAILVAHAPVNEKQMTPAELKRARKLERRASRRQQASQHSHTYSGKTESIPSK